MEERRVFKTGEHALRVDVLKRTVTLIGHVDEPEKGVVYNQSPPRRAKTFWEFFAELADGGRVLFYDRDSWMWGWLDDILDRIFEDHGVYFYLSFLNTQKGIFGSLGEIHKEIYEKGQFPRPPS